MDEGAGRDRQLLPARRAGSGSPWLRGCHAVPDLGADGAMSGCIGARRARRRARGSGAGFRGPRGACPVSAAKYAGSGRVRRRPAARGTAGPALPGGGIGVEHRAGGEPDQDENRPALPSPPVSAQRGRRPLTPYSGAAFAPARRRAGGAAHSSPGRSSAPAGSRARCAARRPASPLGAQAPAGRGELVLPAGRGRGQPRQRQAPLCTCSRPGEQHASGLGLSVASTANRSRCRHRAHAARTRPRHRLARSPPRACSSSR